VRDRAIGLACLLSTTLLTLACAATRGAPTRGGEPNASELLRLRAEILRAEDLREPAAARELLGNAALEVRAAAALALGRIGDPGDRAGLETLLDDAAPTVRARAALGLGLLGQREAAPALASHATDPEAEVRAAVADALGRLAAPETAPALLGLLADADPGVLVAASFAVLGFERPAFAVDRLLALASSQERDALLAAVETLARLSARPRWLELEALRKVRARMIELTGSREAELRRLGAVGLTVPGSDAEAAAVGGLVEDAEAEVRIAAIAALSFPGAPLEPFLVKVFDDKDERVELALVEGLGRMRGDEILSALADIVVSTQPLWLREAAVRAASKVSGMSPRLTAGLSRSLEPELRQAAAALLIGRIDAETAVFARRLYADPDPLVRAAIVPAFAELEGNLIDTLAEAMRAGEPRVRAAVAEAAGRRLAGEGLAGPSATEDAIDVLVALWPRGATDPRVALAIVGAAARAAADERLRSILEEARTSSHRAVRDAAARTLERVYADRRPRPPAALPDRGVDEYMAILRWAERPHAAIVTVERPSLGASARFTIRLNAREAPLGAWSFAELAKTGFYDQLPFFRVVPNAFAVTGDPAGDGTGWPVVEVRDELGAARFWPGTIARVSNGRDDGGNQWLVTLRTQPLLAATHTALGTVVQNFSGVVSRTLPGDRVVSIQIYEGDGSETLPVR